MPVWFETVVLEGINIENVHQHPVCCDVTRRQFFCHEPADREKWKCVDVMSDSGTIWTGRRGTYFEPGGADDVSPKVPPQIY